MASRNTRTGVQSSTVDTTPKLATIQMLANDKTEN